jgi:hypothetical protein
LGHHSAPELARRPEGARRPARERDGLDLAMAHHTEQMQQLVEADLDAMQARLAPPG